MPLAFLDAEASHWRQTEGTAAVQDDWALMAWVGALTAGAVAGVAGIPHCGLMCGPLACVAGPTRAARLTYQWARIGAYAAAGALAGSVARATHAVSPWFSIVAGALLLMGCVAAGWGWRLPGNVTWLTALARFPAKLPVQPRALFLGATTVLLPCGLLYTAIALSAATGAASLGAVSMLSFAVASAPGLWLAQAVRQWLPKQRLPVWTKQVVPVLAALLLIWRGAQALQAQTESRAMPCHVASSNP